MYNRGLHVLIVDHWQVSRESRCRLLEQAAYVVTPAANGVDALVCALDTPFDVCIIDSNLTDMDGFEVSEQIREESEEDSTIIMLVDPSDELRKAYLSQMVTYAGGDYFFAKPCDDHLLLMLLEEIDATRHASGPPSPTGSAIRAGKPTRVLASH